MKSTLLGYECARCGAPASGTAPFTVSCCCEAPLVSRYDLQRAAGLLPAPGSGSGQRGLWRYAAVLPLTDGALPVTLGEGGTPLLPVPRLGAVFGIPGLYGKMESANPTGSFKDRGMTVAVSLARAARVPGVALPTAGNAGAAAAAYAARAGFPASIHSPHATPREILAEIRMRGARLTLHDGTIRDAGKAARADAADRGYLDVATFKEPGRVEGKKTMGYELREDLGRLPDAVVYPCGGGTGIVAMAKAFEEMAAVGWWDGPPPRLYAVQTDACAPIVDAWSAGATEAQPAAAGETIAAGLRVPAPFAHREILTALRATAGGALSVSEEEIRLTGRQVAESEGILPCPEGAAAWAGARKLLQSGDVRPDETVVVFETASGLKYLDAWSVPA